MAAINFPDAPTNGQIFESGGMSWTYVAGIGWTLNSAIVEAGSGFTFIADTMPLPVNVGDTWFDSSTGASGGTSWVAVEEGPAGASEKVWVQFAPGIGIAPGPQIYTAATKTALDALVVPTGSIGMTLDNGAEYRKLNAGWSLNTPYGGQVTPQAYGGNWVAGTALAYINLAADPGQRLLDFSWHGLIYNHHSSSVDLVFSLDGVGSVAQYRLMNPNGALHMVNFKVNVALPTAGGRMAMINLGGTVGMIADLTFNAMYYRVTPKV